MTVIKKGQLYDQPQKIHKQTSPPALSQTIPTSLGQSACKMKRLNKNEIQGKLLTWF